MARAAISQVWPSPLRLAPSPPPCPSVLCSMARPGGGGGGGFEGEVPLPDVPLPGANAYEAEGGGDVNSTFGAYDVAANQGGETGVEMGAPAAAPRGACSRLPVSSS